MTRLTRIIAPALAATMLAGIAVPASAASWNTHNGARAEIAQLDRQIDRAKASRQLDWREASRFERQVDELERLYRQFARGGFTRAENNMLDRRINAVQAKLRQELRSDRRGHDNRSDHDNRRDYRR